MVIFKNRVELVLKDLSLSERIPLRDPIIHRGGHHHTGTHDGRELPGKSVRFLLLLDCGNNFFDSDVELHQIRHLRMASGGKVGLDETRMNRRYTNAGTTQIDSQTFKIS